MRFDELRRIFERRGLLVVATVADFLTIRCDANIIFGYFSH